MPDNLAAKLTLDDFIRVSTASALAVLREQEKIGGLKQNPKIWVGILVDPWGPLAGAGGPGGVGGGGLAGGGQ
jgi:hypothetical protein